MAAVVVGAALSAGAAGIGAAIAGTAISTAMLVSGAISLVTGGLSMLLAPKPPKSNFSASSDLSGLTRQVRQPISDRKVLLGEVRASGPLAFIASSDTNKYLHLVILLSDCEVEEIGETFINDESVPNDYIDGAGLVTEGTYANKVRIKKHLGSAAQTADADLVGIAGWSSDHKLSGIAYAYVRLEWDRALWPGGIPGLSWWVRGKKDIVDVRDDTPRFTMNPTLMVRDYFIDTRRGVGAPATRIDDDEAIASANICEEFVTTLDLDQVIDEIDTATNIISLVAGDSSILPFVRGDKMRLLTTGSAPGGLATATDYYLIPYQRRGTPRVKLAASYADALASVAIDITSAGTGTHTLRRIAEPRYSAGGTIDLSVAPDKHLKEMLSSMAGNAIYCSGKWRILAGAYAAPTVSFNESNLIGGFVTQTRQSKRDRFNRVKGVYAAPINVGQPSDYPVFNSAIRQAEDGEIISIDLNLPWTQRPQTAQRLCKIASERMRQEIIFTADFDLSALQVTAGENISFSFARYGWTNKVFEILNWAFTIKDVNGVPTPAITMTLKETASDIYDFTSGTEESPVDPAPNTELPDPYFVAAPTSLLITTQTYYTNTQDPIPYIVLSWAIHPNSFVTQGGHYEVQFKKSVDSDWSPSFMVDGLQTFTPIYGVIDQVNYDVRIRAVNSLGRPSGWSLLSGFTIGSPSSGADVLLDYQLFSIAEDIYLVYGSFQETIDTVAFEIDYGEFT